jgi:hypothetical protein
MAVLCGDTSSWAWEGPILDYASGVGFISALYSLIKLTSESCAPEGFKICPEKRMVLASTPAMRELGNGGVVLAVSLDARYRQSGSAFCPFAMAGRGYTHIEYTNQHLICKPSTPAHIGIQL